LNVLLVSQCSKQALVETRRILDQFAERKGERTWQTAITQQGLTTLRKMLNKTARRNTSVACHWIKTANRTELLWIVGNIQRFNEQGSVPTNTTQNDVLRSKDENLWHTVEDIALLAGLAGLFHDFGKSNILFQKKLNGQGKTFEPYRHEWISLRLFQAFVRGQSDQEWLEQLLCSGEIDEQNLLDSMETDGLIKTGNPFKSLPPLARTIGWLIISHHRLPKWPGKIGDSNGPRLKKIEKWFSNKFDSSWNSPQCLDNNWTEKDKKAVWEFGAGLPFQSETWQAKAKSLTRRALKRPSLFSCDQDWLTDTFSMHLARMVLMLSDHYYSAHEITLAWQDSQYNAFANTDRNSGKLKQKLDEHVVGVAHNSVLLAGSIPELRRTLPAITRHKGFKKRSKNPQFRWQDKAYELACGVRRRASENGFFGINMASTGCGKTFANGRIMYGLADEKLGCRFSVALGLRTLTLQTGDALKERLHLQDDDLAVMIGSQAVRQLHGFNDKNEKVLGSESAEDIITMGQYVRYEGSLDDGRLSKWLKQTPKLHQLVSAPILVSTIDHLVPATEGERGGKQIAPMLRLLTSDLVLDEPDDFNLADTHALCRLVNWAAMLGSRVLVSSATLPPSLIEALFAAYISGRKDFQKVCGEPGRDVKVCCAWFDENRVFQSDHNDTSDFAKTHQNFVQKRIAKLQKSDPLRQAELLSIEVDNATSEVAITDISETVQKALFELHSEHGQLQLGTDKKISMGLVRMANINPMVAVAKKLLAMQPPANHRVHYCIYHSQHPLAVRSAMEHRLDKILTRHDPQLIWQQQEVNQVLKNYPEDNHLFVVFATSVAEVGRDHDYDWAIAEPSSMRSLIQLAGRIQRHRKIVPSTPNLLILSQNYKALTGSEVAYFRPGFESEQFQLISHDLRDVLEEKQFKVITSIPRITRRNPLSPEKNLADLEHAHLSSVLFGNNKTAGNAYTALWWNHNAHWCYELQRLTPFRKSVPDIEYVFYLENEGDAPEFNRVNERGELKLCDKEFKRIELEINPGVSFWGQNNAAEIMIQLAEEMEMDIEQASRRFGVIRLRDQRWFYHPVLGVHDSLD